MAEIPTISVIIPVFNSSYIEECIQSCFNQTLESSALEVIVINDASTDGTAERLNEVGKKYALTTVHLDSNVGPAAARNAGLEIARGEYIAFLDSDDMMKPEKLARQLEFSRKNTDIEAIISGIEEIDAAGVFMRELVRNFPVTPEAQVETLFLDNLHTITSTLIFKRSLLKSTAFMDPNLLNLEDMDFALKLLQHTKMAYLPECLTIRRVLSSGLSQSVSESIFISSRQDFYSNAVRIFPYLSDIGDKYWSLNYARLGRVLQRQNQGRRARNFYFQSLRSRFNLIAFLGLGLTFLPANIQKQLAAINWRKS